MREATVFAKEKGTVDDRENKNCMWWLRTAGVQQGVVAGVNNSGKLNFSWCNVDGNYAVRPAIWISLEP